MRTKSITRNYIYNLIYHLFMIIVPILVTPYVARVLGENASGQYSFSYSINYYFLLIATLGFDLYGQRLIASHQGSSRQQTIDFFEILISRTFPGLTSLVLYILLVVSNVFDPKYQAVLLVQTLNIIAAGMDLSFFFRGNEEFGKIIFRNIIIRVVGFACIFLFIKTSDDLVLYTVIQCSITFLSAVSLWVYLPKYLVRVSVSEIHPGKHLKPAFVLFLPTIATSVYTYLDKTLIGVITGVDSENGNYTYAESLVKMALIVVTSIGTVIIPRNSARFESGDVEGVKKNIQVSCQFVLLVGIPMMFGCMSIAYNLIPWYLGDGYTKARVIMQILSPIIILIGLSNVFGLQYLIPSKHDKQYTIAICIGAGVNFFLNIILIRCLSSYGAAIATVIAEMVVTSTMFGIIKKEIQFTEVYRAGINYLLGGLIMYLPCAFISQRISSSILHSLIIVVLGIVVYICYLLAIKDVFFKHIVKKVIRTIKR